MTPLAQFYADTFQGDYEAKGVSIRNIWSGDIVLSEIPVGATIRAAYLYWMVLNPIPACSTGTFDGHALDGIFVGSDEDPCWGLSESCYVWRQEVTPWVTGNGTYTVAIDSVVDGTGNDRGEGTSLIVFYEDAGEPEKVFIIREGCVTLKGSLDEYQWTVTGFTADLPCTEEKTAFLVGDGQGVGQADSMFYNGTCIDWNLSEGFDGPYWDTRTYDVTALTPGGSTQSNYRYHPGSSKDDCVTLGVCVLGVSRDLVGIEMSSFSAKQSTSRIVVSWRLESEQDISHFILMRAENHSDFREIVQIPGQGNSPQPYEYRFIDEEVEPKITYRYRLGVVKNSGVSQWFGPIVCTPLWSVEPKVHYLSSNPATEIISFSYTLSEQERLEIEIRDISGRRVETIASGLYPPGVHCFTWNKENVSVGVFFIVVKRSDSIVTRKVLIF
jgi:hypothetical protein